MMTSTGPWSVGMIINLSQFNIHNAHVTIGKDDEYGILLWNPGLKTAKEQFSKPISALSQPAESLETSGPYNEHVLPCIVGRNESVQQ